MMLRRNLLIHLFDKEVLDLYSASQYPRLILEADFRRGLKLAHLFCPGSLLLPLSSYYESDIVPDWVDELGPLFAAQDLQIVSSELDYNEFIGLKREQYKREPARHPNYYDGKVAFKLRDLGAPTLRRTRSSTKDIAAGWDEHFRDERVLEAFSRARKSQTATQFEQAFVEVPERLGGDAFIWDYVKALVPLKTVSSAQALELKSLISRSYVRSYLEEFDAAVPAYLRLADFTCGLQRDELFSIRGLRQLLRSLGLLEDIERLSWIDAQRIKHEPAFQVFAERIRVLLVQETVPVPILEAFAAAKRKFGSGKGPDHIVKRAALIAEECNRVSVPAIGILSRSLQLGKPKFSPSELDGLLRALQKIPSGRDDAVGYERAIEALLTALFEPVLFDPQTQVEQHEGRKRVDITYSNMGSGGFFQWIAAHGPCRYVFVECKNYSGRIGNPELDQLAGRFSPIKGQFGLLVCRKFRDFELIMKSCGDTAGDGRGLIIPLEDDDLATLVAAKKDAPDKFFDVPLFKSRLDRILQKDFSGLLKSAKSPASHRKRGASGAK